MPEHGQVHDDCERLAHSHWRESRQWDHTLDPRWMSLCMSATSGTEARPPRTGPWRAVGTWLLAAGLIGIGVAFSQRVQAAREAALAMTCRGNLSQITMALLNYHDAYGSFPPAYLAGPDGRPQHSWRVLILPFIDGSDLYRDYRFEEAWDSPHNLDVARRLPMQRFQCPSHPRTESALHTDYVVVTGAGTAFPGSRSVRFEDMADGPANSILLVEIARSDILWTEPRDLAFDTMSFTLNDPQRASLGSAHPLGPAVVFADGIKAYRLNRTITPEMLQGILTIAGGEPLDRDHILQLNQR